MSESKSGNVRLQIGNLGIRGPGSRSAARRLAQTVADGCAAAASRIEVPSAEGGALYLDRVRIRLTAEANENATAEAIAKALAAELRGNKKR